MAAIAALLDVFFPSPSSSRIAAAGADLLLAGVALAVTWRHVASRSPGPWPARTATGLALAGAVALSCLAAVAGALPVLIGMLLPAAGLVMRPFPRPGPLAGGLALGASLGGLLFVSFPGHGPGAWASLGVLLVGASLAMAECRSAASAAAMVLAGVGWMGLAGRLAPVPLLEHGGIHPAPMAIGTAGAFILLGQALVLASRHRLRAAAGLGAPALVLGLAALGAPLRHVPATGAGPAGEMASTVLASLPPVAVAAALVAAELALLAGWAAGRWRKGWAVVWGVGVLVCLLGLVTAVGMVFAPGLLQTFGGTRTVSAPGMAGLLALGVGLVASSPRTPWESRGRTLFFPAAVGAIVVLAALGLWAVLVRQQADDALVFQRQQQDGVLAALRDGLQIRATAIQRMARRLGAVDDATRQRLFPVDARQYLDDLHGLGAVGYLDGQRTVRMLRSQGDSGMAVGARIDDARARREVFDAVDASGDVRLSGPVRLPGGGPGALIVAPAGEAGGGRGYVVGVLDYRELFPVLLATQGTVDRLRIEEDGRPLFARGDLGPARGVLDGSVALYGQAWRVALGRSGQARASGGLAPILVLGFALGGMLAVVLRLSALARERARLAERVSQELRDQIEAREVMRAALVDAERDMIAVLESISDGVFMVDRAWRFTYVNPQAAAMFHARGTSLQGVLCWKVLAGVLDDAEADGALQRAWERSLRDRVPLNVEAPHVASRRCYELRAYPHARGLTVYLHDVSARKRQERELLKRDADSRHALQLGCMGSWELHLGTGYLHWSPETCAIFGVASSPEEEGMEALRRRVHPDDWAALMQDQDRLAHQEDAKIDRQYRMVRPDGEMRVIRALAERVSKNGDPIIAGAVQDITEQQQAREALARALEATQLVMDSAPDVIIVLDREGCFLRVSAAAERLWGYAPDSLVGASMAKLIHPDDLASSFAAVAEMAAGQAIHNFRNRNVARDGRILYMQWSGVWSAQAQCLYVVGRDHTQMHRVEEMEAAKRRVLLGIASGEPLDAVLGAVVQAYETQQPEAVCSVLLLRGDRLFHGAAPHLPRQYVKAINGARIGPEAGSCGTAAWRRERVVVTDIATDPLWESYASLALPHGLLACWSTPIMARDGTVLGTFAVYYGDTRQPTDGELASIDALAALAAIAIEHELAFNQLSESEQRFRSLFEHHPDAVFALDGDGRVLGANPAAALLLGEQAASLQQRSLGRHLVPDDRARLEAALATAAGGESERLEVGVQDASGQVFPANLVTLPIMVGGAAHGVFAVLQDQRELRRAQQATASQLALLSAVADSVGEGLLAVDAAGTPTFLNRTAARLLDLPVYGLPREEALPATARQALQVILEGSGLASKEDARFVLGDGQAIDIAYVATPLRTHGRLDGAVIAFRDIGDLKQARRSLSERQRFFELSLEVFCILDPQSGHFVQVNPAFCRLLGYDETALRAIPLLDLVHPQDRMATGDAVEWQQESGEPLAGFVNRLRRADGSEVWLEWTSRRSPEGLIFAVARDVTAKRAADAALAKAVDDLRIRNRELQDFAYVASHDLQEPLRKIQAFSDRLQSRLANGLDESSRDYLQRMGDAASRMQTLIDDLLAYSRVGTRTATPGAVDLSAELATVLDDLDARIAEAGATIESDRLPTLQADASQVRQLLQNLLANALKFRAPDRPCRIQVRARPLGEPPQEPDRWEMRVQDNGIGFDPAYAERIFAPFQRLHPRNMYAGTGIGLAIVRRIVERHGGSIHAEGRVGEGACFVVTLPVRVAASLTRMADDAPLSHTDLSGARS